jgi:membrane protease YdiL (CAAX protease family)
LEESSERVSVIEGPVCSACRAPINLSDQYCGACGRAIAHEPSPVVRQDVFEVLRPALAYYFLTLVILGIYKFTSVFPEGFEGIALVSLIDILVAIAFWMANASEMKALFSLKSIDYILMAKVLGASVVGGVFIHFFADLIQVSISDDVFYDLYLFEDTPFPFLFSVLFICVQPALFEEVAFRGFLFNNMTKVTTGTTAVYITAFVFGIMHFAIISMLWLVPLGAIFAYLRLRHNTLWYGMVGHFSYNFTIIFLQFLGW